MNRQHLAAILRVLLGSQEPQHINNIAEISKVGWFDTGDVLVALGRIGVARGSNDGSKPTDVATHSVLVVRGNEEDMLAMIWRVVECERLYEEAKRDASTQRNRIANIHTLSKEVE